MQKKKGISLIVLVITIIVMVILAGAIILTLNNSGIIQKASDAVEETNLATAKEVATLAWAEAYADGVRTVENLADGTKGFKTRIEETFEKNNIDVDKYNLTVTTSGVEVKLISSMWVKEGFTVVKGDTVLKIGDTINYNAGVSTYTADWKVLGVDDDGNLLIMSSNDVSTLGLAYESNLAKAQQDWLNVTSLLDAECEPYGYGEGAVGKARSITVEDVNKVTGYDPETASNGNPYGSGQLYQYGNEVTYKYNETTKPAYESAVKSGTLSSAHSNGFYYYNEETKEFKHITDLTTGTSGNVFAELTSNGYQYYATTLTTMSTTKNEEAFEMIYGEDYVNEDKGGVYYTSFYWLASPAVSTNNYGVRFGVFAIYSGQLESVSLWDSNGETGGISFAGSNGVRAVVTLSSDIQITEKTDTGWGYTVN